MSVREDLLKLKIIPSKERGQNFLIDPAALAGIVEFSDVSESDSIVEIGAGLGALTNELKHFPDVTAIEIESRFCNELSSRFPSVKVVNANVLEVAFEEFGDQLVVFGNLPYSLSTDILFHVIGQAYCIKRAVFLLQREFAERIAARPGTREASVLTISCQLRARTTLGMIVPGSSFYPQAGVESRLVRLDFYRELPYRIEDEGWFHMLVRAAFSQRRRKMFNALLSTGLLTKDLLEKAFSAAGLDRNVRAEMLTIEEFAEFANQTLKLKS
ncbi:MAG: ribosomal RNA small subunit methyltransferase A [Candidatus Dadabacteria bacterium]|nr:MAG: ribosomal RNA small subunit methyltransferase A [Candidatus Dadabacteria bacterium]